MVEVFSVFEFVNFWRMVRLLYIVMVTGEHRVKC